MDEHYRIITHAGGSATVQRYRNGCLVQTWVYRTAHQAWSAYNVFALGRYQGDPQGWAATNRQGLTAPPAW